MKLKHLFIRVALVWCVFSLMQAFAQEASVTIEVLTTFEYPNSRATYPQKINNAGDITGYFYDELGARRGFVRFADGRFSRPITEPNDNLDFTFASGLNNSHTLCGVYETQPDFVVHSFFLSGGTFTEFDVSGALNTWVFGINDAGNFCGYIDASTGGSSGFVNIGGSTTVFSAADALITFVFGMNNLNQCVGCASLGDSTRGFIRDADGTLSLPINVPGAQGTVLNDINDRGWVVGKYCLSESTLFHAVFFQTRTKFVTFDYPGAPETIFTGINGHGLICGYYSDGSGNTGVGILARVSREPAN
jgi:hypothetical protein